MRQIQMQPRTRRSLVAISVAALLGLTACGSDEKKSTSDPKSTSTEQSSPDDSNAADVTVADVTLPDGVTLPAGVTIPSLSEECLGYYQVFATALGGDVSGLDNADETFAALKARVPDELKADFELVSTALGKLVEVSKKYEGNPTAAYTDPELLALFSDSGFTAAAERVNTWLTTECATTG